MVHCWIVEVIAFQAPSVEKGFAELLRGNDGEVPILEIHLSVAERLWVFYGIGGNTGIENKQVVLSVNHDFLAIGRDLKALDSIENGFGLIAFVCDGDTLECALLRVGTIVINPTKFSAGDCEDAIVAWRHRDLLEPGSNTIEVDLDLLDFGLV